MAVALPPAIPSSHSRLVLPHVMAGSPAWSSGLTSIVSDGRWQLPCESSVTADRSHLVGRLQFTLLQGLQRYLGQLWIMLALRSLVNAIHLQCGARSQYPCIRWPCPSIPFTIPGPYVRLSEAKRKSPSEAKAGNNPPAQRPRLSASNLDKHQVHVGRILSFC